LKFPFLSFLERLRTGLITLFLKTYPEWKNLEKIKASSWLKKYYGQKAYQVLWQPLLKSKFGDQTEEISMAWFWARIKKRSSKLGYLEGGFQVLIKSLREKIEKNGGQVFLNHEVKNLNNLKDFDQIIVTTPAEAFLKIAAGLPKDYQNRLRKLEMLGALNLVLVSKEKFLTDGTYWLNINEPDFPFVAVVEHTNFIDPQSYANQQLVYVGGYYPQNHRYFKMKKEQIFKEWLPFLQKINPQFNPLSLISYCLFLDQFAQPIIPLHYSKIIPRFKTPIPHVYLANMQMVYPWDRGTNYAIELGKKVASEVSQDV
jgi:protoporphyrinogen oxidase